MEEDSILARNNRVKNVFMDLFLTDMQLFTSQGIN